MANNLTDMLNTLNNRMKHDRNDSEKLHGLLRELMNHSLNAADQTRTAKAKDEANRNNPINV